MRALRHFASVAVGVICLNRDTDRYVQTNINMTNPRRVGSVIGRIAIVHDGCYV
jgi:hypothetical protein